MRLESLTEQRDDLDQLEYNIIDNTHTCTCITYTCSITPISILHVCTCNPHPHVFNHHVIYSC